MKRRKFMYNFGMMLSFSLLHQQIDKLNLIYNEEEFWKAISKLYSISKGPLINLNNGSTGIVPDIVMNELQSLMFKMNAVPPYEFADDWFYNYKPKVMEQLSHFIGTDKEEVELVTNTTQGINHILNGIEINEGDELLYANWDYKFATNSMDHKAKECRATIQKIEEVIPLNNKEIIRLYKEAINPKTKLLLVSHVTYRQGAIMPLKEIIEIAHQNGARVLVDGAHAIGQIALNIHQLNCDFYCTSLHKWMSAPHGTGVMFIKKEHISSIEGPYSSNEKDQHKISKFYDVGTRGFYQDAGIKVALDFHAFIGSERKFKRLKFLTDYWVAQLKDVPQIDIFQPESYGALTLMKVKGMKGSELYKTLENHHIHVKKTVHGKDYDVVRVTPNLYTLPSHLDQFVMAMKDIVA